ncbi:MAG: MBL fold metallo-hydrolase [Allosphingosinicella sp.]
MKLAWMGAALAQLIAGCAAAKAPPAAPHLIPGYYGPARQPDGNTIMFEGPDGLVVVDTGRYPDHQAKILAYARERGKPVTAIVNTHWHLDHSGGNAEIRAVYPQAKLYASNAVAGALEGFLARSLERGRARLADPAASEAEKADIRLGVEAIEDRRDLLPDVPVTGPTTLALGKRRLELHVAPRAATEGDVWIYDPATRTLVAGDLVVIPAPFFDTACADGWRKALDEIARMPFATLIPGHGAPMGRADFEVYRTAYGKLVDCAQSEAVKSACIEGWLSDAAKFLPAEQDRTEARELLDYYLDNVLRSPAKRKEFCG